MKKFILLLMLFLFLIGCTKKPNISFCEGVSPEGKGIECGIKFETGDLTAMIKADKAFGVNRIDIAVFELNEKKSEKVETISIDVPPDEIRANINLSFYKGGKFRVTAMNGSEKIGEGEIEVLDNL
jgi:hypothetical protein